MDKNEEKSEIKSEIAKEKPRDYEGHFVHVDQPKTQSPQTSPNDPISQFITQHTHYSKNQDDLIDVHVGNPLRKITLLLEEIKKQKAFSFTLRGSLGIMGVFLALSVFGVFGGGKLLCDKGVQSQIGVIKTLAVYDTDGPTIPVLSSILDYFSPKKVHQRSVLVKENEAIINLPFSKDVNLAQYQNLPVMLTGNYDACSQTLKVTDPAAIEFYLKPAR